MTDSAGPLETTVDDYLGGRLRMSQPKAGLRIGSDALLLAAAVPARAGERALDLGAGVGPASLALACRVPGLDVTGIEIEPALADLARANADRNGLSGRVRFITADLSAASVALVPAGFDHVLANPPFFTRGRHAEAPGPMRRLARSADRSALASWIAAAARYCRPGGSLTLIWRAEREVEATDLMAADFGAIRILPLIARAGTPPKRLLFQARRGLAEGRVRRCPPLELHGPDGRYRPEIDAILRGQAGLEFC